MTGKAEHHEAVNVGENISLIFATEAKSCRGSSWEHVRAGRAPLTGIRIRPSPAGCCTES
jgi:hypothetical protein